MNNPLLIGIAGGSASGKSRLAEMLAARLADLSVRTLHMDAFFLKEMPTWTSPWTGNPVEDHNHPACFDLPRLYADVENLLRPGSCDVAIVEGLLILQDDRIRPRLSLRVFVDCPVEERLYRRMRRNLQWDEPMDQTAGFYLSSVRYRHDELIEPSRWHADVVVNGSTRMEQGCDLLDAWIRQRRREPSVA